MARTQGQTATRATRTKAPRAAGKVNATPAARNGARSAPTIGSVATDIVESIMGLAETYLGPEWRKLGEQGQAAFQARMANNVRERLRRALPKLAAAGGAAS